MSNEEHDHKAVVRAAFTQQADAYAANPAVRDRARAMRLVDAVAPAAQARVLDVASGPGYVVAAFAERCREVVGIDLTPAPLARAEALCRERGLANARFVVGDAEALPFADGAFDVAVCRLAFHHFERPARVLGEMARVCRKDGRVEVEDLVASEHAARAAYQNHFERLRDPSHTRALPLGELLDLFAAAGLEVVAVRSDQMIQPVERWLANAQTPAAAAAEVRALLAADAAQDLSGVQPAWRAGELVFTHLLATVVGRVFR